MIEIIWGKFKGERGVIVEKDNKNVAILLESGIEVKVSEDHIKVTKKKFYPFVVTCKYVKYPEKSIFHAFCGKLDLAEKTKRKLEEYGEFYENVQIVECEAF